MSKTANDIEFEGDKLHACDLTKLTHYTLVDYTPKKTTSALYLIDARSGNVVATDEIANDLLTCLRTVDGWFF